MALQTLADFTRENIIIDKIGVEGGYTNDPHDLGGATKFGVTQTTANGYMGDLTHMGWTGNVKDLTQDQAVYVYIHEFWNKMLLDRVLTITPLLADKLFDTGINSGTGTAVTFLQRALNAFNKQGSLYPDIAVDGGMGSGTIAALAAFQMARGPQGLVRLLFTIECLQGANYIQIAEKRPENEAFVDGWEGRVVRDIGRYDRLIGIYAN